MDLFSSFFTCPSLSLGMAVGFETLLTYPSGLPDLDSERFMLNGTNNLQNPLTDSALDPNHQHYGRGSNSVFSIERGAAPLS